MNARKSGLLVGMFQDPSTSGIENPDWHIQKFYDKSITSGINFLTYPIGGWSRYKWQPLVNRLVPLGSGGSTCIYVFTYLTFCSKVPTITLVDAQMGSEQWQCCIAGCVSKWIDPDYGEQWLSKLSVEALEKVVFYFFGVPTVGVFFRNLTIVLILAWREFLLILST